MKQVLNPQIILIAVGVLQPTNPAEVIGFLSTMLPDAGMMPKQHTVLEFLKEREKAGYVIRVIRPDNTSDSDNTSDMYSLTLAGHRYLTLRQRKIRDKFRFYLLRDAHRARFVSPVGGAQRLVGVSPTVDNRTPEKGSVANKIGQCVPSGRSYWPRISRQFDSKTGSPASPSGAFPDWLSFRTQRQCEVAVGYELDTFEFDYEGLAACIGVSPKIISQIANAPERHYRTFELPKRGGGVRKIESPRVFLKVIQWFLADFIFSCLPVHHTVHSFRHGHSIATNAAIHVGKAFVANIDIKDFFGSIKQETVENFLKAKSRFRKS
jgi:hypothetical protein